MNQDKLEEIARLLGGISDKLDVVVGSLTAEQRLSVKEEMEKIAKKRERVRARAWDRLSSIGYVAKLDTEAAEKAASDAKEAAQHAEALAHRATFGDWQK